MPDLRPILNAINAAALNPAAWQDAMDSVSALCGGLMSHMIVIDPDQPVPWRSVVSGYDPAYLQTYDAHYARLNAWAPAFMREPVGVVIPVQQMLPHDALRRTEFYNDWILPQDDASAGGGMVLGRGVDSILLLGANIPQRHAEQGQKDWLEALPLIAAAVHHAIDVNRALFGLRFDLFLAQTEGAGPNAAVFLLGEADRLLHCNAQAGTMIASGEMVLHRIDGRLKFRDPQTQSLVDQAGKSRTSVQVALPGAGGRVARIVPLSEPDAEALNLRPVLGNLRPVRVALITTPAKPVEIAPLLRRLYGLTEAELDLSLHLANGLTPNDIAERRRVSIHTVRNQIKSTLEKTGLRRQADLVGLVERSRRR